MDFDFIISRMGFAPVETTGSLHLLCGIDDSHSMQLTHLTCNLVWVEITDVPADTKDKDEILESEFFDTRQAFEKRSQKRYKLQCEDVVQVKRSSSHNRLFHIRSTT
ncbi:hypothetical protein JHK82_043991 [Glycine max]|nr:hypothetical protein JHK85_044548 [Glycine max]KAG5107021.1 hypothetical protein JHK82_043991 [Glycine max]